MISIILVNKINLPPPSTRKLNVTKVTNIALRQSSQIPKAVLVAINCDHAEVCRSCNRM